MEQAIEGSRESDIINIAINIFQNVGIRRWIEEIEILKNEQIYFEICKIIFPETIIHLFRLSENHALTTGQKIQGVIDLIAKIIKNDLYHISGEAIANGKITHLKNFLQLLEALSNSMISKCGISVESAPENDKSLTYNEHNKSYYTVIGIDKEFGDMTVFDLGPNQEEPGRARSHTTTDPGDQPLPPNYAQIAGAVDDKPSRSKQHSPTQNKTPLVSERLKENQPYPSALKDKNLLQFQQQHRPWLDAIKGMNQTKVNLQKDRMQETKQAFIRWKINQDYHNRATKQRIEGENEKRKQSINQNINERQLLLNSLKGQEEAARAIKTLFKQEKQMRANSKVAMKAREEKKLKKIQNFKELDQLLALAVKSNKSQLLYNRE